MSLDRQHSFWGSLSPLGGLVGASILILASGRLSWAVTVAGCIFWVYGLSSFTYFLIISLINKEKFFPKDGKSSVFICIASFWGTIYLFIFWLLCPFAALECFLLILLVPLFCASSEIIKSESIDIQENVSKAISQAAILSGLLILFSIIREPLSYCMLSFPGSYDGMVTIMYFKENAFFPIRIFSTSAGAFLILGYIIYLYQYAKNYIMPGER